MNRRALRTDRGHRGSTSLLAAGANLNAQLKLFPPYRGLRMDCGADSILGIGTTPLLRAARGADVAAIERLAKAGALLDLPQRDGITPLMAAVDERDRTALHYAVSVGYTDVAKRLVEHGAGLLIADVDGVTPVDAANGKLKGGQRGGGTAYPKTAKRYRGYSLRPPRVE
jgi:ankyrin repeat protein